ncbi:hypothetical protein [Salicola sp. Rm-C-2C1-2]|uniref:hypothetical protein n=1 Tax=Salicola sp. Rm-C-2C1-2 TaxID=3141321 RepID=UPI0032E509EF
MSDGETTYSEETLNQIVCWRETFTRWFVLDGKETKDSPNSKERTTVCANLDDYQAEIDDFLAVLNDLQCEIKSVIIFQKGKAFTKKSLRLGAESGGGWGFGWGVSVPDRIQVFYEQVEYITYRQYLNRREAALGAIQARIEQGKRQTEIDQEEQKIRAERERQRESKQQAEERNRQIEEQKRQIEQQVNELEREKASVHNEIDSIRKNGIKKTKRSLIGSDIVYNFNSINYETLEEAEAAQENRLLELQDESVRIEEEIDRLRNSKADG